MTFEMLNDVVILIPSYEPDHYLVNVVKELNKEGFPILIVNDGSGQEYDEVFNSVKDLVEYIKYEKNKGKGGALKKGYKNILSLFPEAKFVITADGDGQHSIKDIKRMYELLKENDELVLGVRIFDKNVPFRSRFGNEWSKFNRGILTKQYIEDDQCGLRGFPVRYLPELIKIKGQRYEYEMNQLTSFQLRDYRIITMPIDVIYIDGNSKSHFSNFTDTVRIHSRIIIPGIPSIICFLLTMASLLTLYHFNYSFYHLMVFPAYLVWSLFYALLLSFVHPSNNPIKRMLKELLFTTVKMTSVFMLMYLFVDAFKLTYFVAIPLLMILAISYNLILPKIFKFKE